MSSQILAEYPSKSNANKSYNISRDDKGVTWCDCWQWKLHRTCSHLEDYLGSQKIYKVRKETIAGKINTYLDLEAAINRAVQELS